MKKHLWIVVVVLISAMVLSSCINPFTAPEDTPKNECSKACKDIYDLYWPGAPIGGCVSQCQTGKYTAFKSTCNEESFMDAFGFETKKDCLNFWDSLK